MDYVVFGIGFGATILVLGLLLRDFGPRLRFRTSADGGDVLSAEELVGKVSWTRFCTALGSVLALAGAAFLITTLVAMILVVSDDTGLWIMSIAYGLLLVIMAYWTWAYFHRFGSYGILPERAEPERADDTPPYQEREEQLEAEEAFAGPPLPATHDDAGAADSGDAAGDELTAETEETAGELAVNEPGEEVSEAPEPEHDESRDEPAPVPGPRLETPEERLAHAESPIDHGSAEGELDLAASGPRRPGGRTSRQVRLDETPDGDDADSALADDRDRA